MNVYVPLNFTCWNTIPLVREFGIDVYPLLYLKLIKKKKDNQEKPTENSAQC